MTNARTLRAAAWSWTPPKPLIWSSEMSQLHDVGADSFSGKLDDYIARIHTADRDEFESGLWRALEQGQATYLEYRLASPGHSGRRIATTIHPDNFPAHPAVHGVAWELTQAADRAGAHPRPSSATDEILRMAACAIHDLRNPLNTLLIRAASMLAQSNEVVLPDGWRANIEVICRSVHSIQRAAADWELYHRLQVGAPVIDAKPVLLNDFLEELRDSLGASLVTSWLDLDADLTASPTMIVCDARRVAHALVDLVVCAGTRALQAADARLRVASSGGNIEIIVERQAKAAEHSAMERAALNKSLALLVAEKIIHAHGGAVAVAPGERPDVAFSFLLPVAAAPGVYTAVRTA